MQTGERADTVVRSWAQLQELRVEDILYPESDGRPMGETELHVREILRLFATLDAAFRERPDVYVGADLIVYYEQHNPGSAIVPDVFVAVGVPKSPHRRVYKLWEEPGPPTFVIEVTSRSSRDTDRVLKPDVYRRMGVQEYVLYDPTADYLSPSLQGYRLVGTEYQPLPVDPDGSLVCAAHGLSLRLVDGQLRLIIRATGQELLSHEERVRMEAAAREIESQARQRAEARIAELEAELRRLRGEAQ